MFNDYEQKIVYPEIKYELNFKRNWSVRELARRSGISVWTLSRFLKGKSKSLNLGYAIKVTEAFGYPKEEVFRLFGR